jgi:TonB family protein
LEESQHQQAVAAQNVTEVGQIEATINSIYALQGRYAMIQNQKAALRQRIREVEEPGVAYYVGKTLQHRPNPERVELLALQRQLGGLEVEEGQINQQMKELEKALQDRPQLAAAVAASPGSNTAQVPTRPIAVYAPRPEYPYEARTMHITGAGVAFITIDPSSGTVTGVSMARSTGSPILDNAIISALRRWRFKPGSYDPDLKIPIAYTTTGASY